MAKKSEPGKKFQYPLKSVLKVRHIRETKEKEKFAEKQRDYLQEKKREEEIREEQRQKRNELKGKIKKGFINDFSEVMRRQAHLGVVKEGLDTQIEKVIESAQHLERQREILIKAMKEKKIIEKHKEHQFDEWQDLMKNIEVKFLDEIATTRHERKKHE